MKKPVLIALALSLFCVNVSSAQNTWTQKGNIGTSGRKYAAAFSIGNKGYIATGLADFGVILNDCWEYDQGTGAWTQKANYGGTARWGGVGFSVGNFGYVGTGNDASAVQSDFYKYNPSNNSWTAVASLPVAARRSACAFATSTKGYVGLGFNNGNPLQDFYEYDPGTNAWTARANFTGAARYSAVAAGANGKGYVGTGFGNSTYYQDWYEFDPTGNSWTAKANFGGGMRFEAMAFGTTGKVYVGTGYDNNNILKVDCQEFDPVGNTWTPRADVTLNTGRRNGAVGFAIGSFGYCATGIGPNGSLMDTWEYTPLTVGVNENTMNVKSVNIFPNPSHGDMTLNYELLKNVSASFLLMDATGNEVLRHELVAADKSMKISEPSLNDGIYFYRVISDGKTMASGKILIAR